MAGTDLLRLILSKYDCFIEVVQSAHTVSAGGAAVWSLSIKEPYVLYIMDFFFYSSEKNMTVSLYDSSNSLMFTVTSVVSLPITHTFYKMIPKNRLYGSNNILGNYSTQGTICAEFLNASAAAADIELAMNCIFIPMSEVDRFEAEIKSFSINNDNIIGKLEEINKNVLSLNKKFKPEFIG